MPNLHPYLQTTLHAARHQAFRAALRGDLEAAERWMTIMRQQLAAARTINDLANPRPRPKLKRSKPKAAPTGPVMLDPDGFSPGGTPNWYLNQKRRDRAGLR